MSDEWEGIETDEADVLAEAIETLRQVYNEFDLTLPL
jgi:hypothetical protein